MSELDDVIEEVVEQLGAELEVDEGYSFLTVATTPPEGTPEDAEVPWEIVSIWGDENGVFVRASVGPVGADVDFATVLRAFADSWYAKVYLDPDEEEGGEDLAIETTLPLGVDAETLTYAVQEVVDKALAMRHVTGVEE